MAHIKLEIIANSFQQEVLIALLDDFNPTGYEQTDEMLKAYFAAVDFQEGEVSSVLKGYQYTLTEVQEQNWNSVWEENFQPVVVGDFCAVRADFHTPITAVQYEIIITPKMSFGTGHHATTYMMMQQMSAIDFKGKTVFDFGTGTGILSILAEKLGAEKITAIDVDNWSIENANENFERNGCNRISVSLSSLLPKERFDIVLANINRNVILSYLPHLAEIIIPNGLILFSGLLLADEQDISDAAKENGFYPENTQAKDGWISLLFSKPSIVDRN